MTKWLFPYLLILLPLIWKSAWAVQTAELPPGISYHRLDNGLEILLIENKGLPMIGVNVVVKVGSAYETFSTSGMSHMLEHLLFNGTESMDQKELYDAVDRIGGYNNAHTGKYYTNFMMVTPTGTFKKGMQIQADMLFRSTLPVDKFEKEKGIVKEEIAQSLGKPAEQLERNIIQVLYAGHALSLPILGTYSTIENMKRDDVYRFYKNHYVPNNMRLSVVGNFKSDEMLGWIQEIYGTAVPGNVDAAGTSAWKTGFSPIVQKNGGSLNHRFYSGKEEKLALFFTFPDGFDDNSISLMETRLGEKSKDLQAKLEIKYPGETGSWKLSIRRTPLVNHLEVSLSLLKNHNLDAIRQTVSEWLAETDFAVTDNQVSIEVVQSRTAFLQNTEKPHMFGIYNAPIIAESGFQPILDSLQGSDLKRAALRLEDIDFIQPPIAILQHPGLRAGSAQQSTDSEIEIQPNQDGSPTLIVKTSPDSGILAIHYLIGKKYGLELKYGKDSAKIWHSILGDRLGTAVQKGDNFRFGFAFTVNDNPWIPMDDIYLHEDFGYVRAEGLADDIPAAISFLNREMLNFTPTREEFESAVKKTQRSSMMGSRNPAEEIFSRTWKSSVYLESSKPEKTESVTYEKLLEFGKIYFRPDNMVISVVSPAGFQEIKKNFSGFAATYEHDSNSLVSWNQEIVLNSEPIEIAKEVNSEQTFLFFGFSKAFQKEEEPALAALDLLLRDHITFDIREKRGMAYRMNAGITLLKEKALFYIRLGTLPENAAELGEAFPTYFTPDFKDQITEDSLQRAVNMYLGRMMFRRLSSINQGFYLGESYYLKQDHMADQDSIEKLSRVTVNEVRRVAEKYLIVENPVRVTVK